MIFFWLHNKTKVFIYFKTGFIKQIIKQSKPSDITFFLINVKHNTANCIFVYYF